MSDDTHTPGPNMSFIEMIDYIEARGYVVISTESIAEIKTIIDAW